MPELLEVGACLFRGLLWCTVGDLKSFHVNTMAIANPATAPTDSEF